MAGAIAAMEACSEVRNFHKKLLPRLAEKIHVYQTEAVSAKHCASDSLLSRSLVSHADKCGRGEELQKGVVFFDRPKKIAV